MLSTVYSEFEWLPWKFKLCPKNFWDNTTNQRKYLDWVAVQLNIKEPNDWYKVTVKVFYK